ncbi:hypothetical protein WN944_012251 [Citrus x changshan-huyou]|uniref:Uncharacterized protein n=1 Tax=Citrus x changshan-huyou TaxID=2935761 RepID=A0AAP0MZU8_9ROSI
MQIFQFISPNLQKDILTRKLEIYCQRRFAPTGNWSQLKTPHNNNRSQQRTPNAKGDLPNEQTKVSTGLLDNLNAKGDLPCSGVWSSKQNDRFPTTNGLFQNQPLQRNQIFIAKGDLPQTETRILSVQPRFITS